MRLINMIVRINLMIGIQITGEKKKVNGRVADNVGDINIEEQWTQI